MILHLHLVHRMLQNLAAHKNILLRKRQYKIDNRLKMPYLSELSISILLLTYGRELLDLKFQNTVTFSKISKFPYASRSRKSNDGQQEKVTKFAFRDQHDSNAVLHTTKQTLTNACIAYCQYLGQPLRPFEKRLNFEFIIQKHPRAYKNSSNFVVI